MLGHQNIAIWLTEQTVKFSRQQLLKLRSLSQRKSYTSLMVTCAGRSNSYSITFIWNPKSLSSIRVLVFVSSSDRFTRRTKKTKQFLESVGNVSQYLNTFSVTTNRTLTMNASVGALRITKTLVNAMKLGFWTWDLAYTVSIFQTWSSCRLC